MKICLFGSASDRISDKYKEETERISYILAKRGHDLIFGGGRRGIMGAAASGFAAGGRKITGVLPKFFIDMDVEVASPHCTDIVYTETMNQRKEIMESMADAYIICPGGIGTFDEFFEVLTNKQLRRHDLPIIVYNIDHFYDELISLVRGAVKSGFVREETRDLFIFTSDIDDAIEYMENYKPTNYKVSELKDS